MPQSVYRNFTPFGNDFMIDKFLRAEPNKHIFAEIDNSFNEEEVSNYLNQGAFDVPGMKMIGEGGETLVAEGFVRSPSQQEQLTFKWRLIVFLIIAFSTIVAINLVSLFSSHVTLHANELKTMEILGAPASVVLKSLFVSITMLSVGVILAVASSIVPFLELANIVLFTSLDSKPKLVFQTEPLFWVVLFTITSLYILGYLSSKVDLGSLFSRQMGVSANKWQKRVVWSFQYIQYVVSLITLMAVLFIAINFFRNSDEYLDLEEVYLVDVTAKGLSGILDYLGAEGEEKSFAVSVTSFVNKHTTKLEDKSLPKGTQAHVFYVSNNYFFVLAGQDTSELWGNKVIVNRAMADLLSDDGFIIGSSLDMGELLGIHVIADVSDNLPHDGITHSAIPAVYMPLGSMRNRDINGLQIIVPKETVTELLLWLKSWLSENAAEYDLSDPLLIQQRIKQVDREEQSMLLLGLNVVILILISIFLNLYYDVKTRLSLEKQDFSVMLAVGASDRAIISNLVMNQLLLLLAATVTLLLLMLFQSEWLGAYPKYLLLSIIPICASALFAIALVSAYAPFYKFKSSSIYSNLRM